MWFDIIPTARTWPVDLSFRTTSRVSLNVRRRTVWTHASHRAMLPVSMRSAGTPASTRAIRQYFSASMSGFDLLHDQAVFIPRRASISDAAPMAVASAHMSAVASAFVTEPQSSTRKRGGGTIECDESADMNNGYSTLRDINSPTGGPPHTPHRAQRKMRVCVKSPVKIKEKVRARGLDLACVCVRHVWSSARAVVQLARHT